MMDIDETARLVHLTAVEHGFWDKERNMGEMLMLVTSELAECLEENRAQRPLVYWRCKDCDWPLYSEPKVTGNFHIRGGGIGRNCNYHSAVSFKPEGELIEIVDAIIRLLDIGQHLSGQTTFTLSDALVLKMRYNKTREHMHGKAY